jgi:hypothetical protein
LRGKYQKMVRLLLGDAGNIQSDFYSEHYTRRERKQMSQVLNQTMWDEIGMLRTLIKRFFGASSNRADQTDVRTFAYDLTLLGLSCTRLARVMQVNSTLQSGLKDSGDDGVNAALQVLLSEMGRQTDDSSVEAGNG